MYIVLERNVKVFLVYRETTNNIRLTSNNNTTYCIFNWEPKMFSDPKKAEEDYVVAVLVLVVIAPFSTLAFLYT